MLLKRTFLYLPAQILSPLAQFLSIVIWTYFCSSETIGIITLVATQQELIRSLLLSWWTHYSLRYINDPSINKKTFKLTAFSIVLLSCLIQILFSTLLLFFIFGDLSIYFYLSSVAFIVFRTLSQHFVTVASAENDTLTYNVLSLTGPVFGLLLGVLLLSIFSDDPFYPIAAFAVSELIGLLYIAYKKNFVMKPVSINKFILNNALKYASPLVIAGALSWLALNAARYMVEDMLGLTAVGLFAIGFGLGQRAASMASMVVTSAALPLAIKVMNEQGIKAAMIQLADNFSLLLFVMLPALVGMYSVQNSLITLLVSTQFVNATLEVLPWAILSGAFFAIIYNFLNHYFILTEKTRLLVYVDGSLALMVILFSYPLINIYGIVGAVMSMCISSFVVIIILSAYLLFKTEFIFPSFFIFKCFLSSFLMYVIIKYVDYHNSSVFLDLLFNVFLGVVLYISLMILLNYKVALKFLRSRGLIE